MDKINRKYENLINILGADHTGYIKRITAAVSALSDNKTKLNCKVCQLVKLYKNGEPCPYYMYSRSSTPIKYGLILGNSVGIIDCGYRGNLMASFYNTKKEPVTISQGTRLVQICMPNLSYDFTRKLVDKLDSTERGEGGFGSTGK